MSSTLNPAMRAAVGSVMSLLVDRHYEALDASTTDRSLDSAALRDAIERDGRVLTFPGGWFPDDVRITQDAGERQIWRCGLPLWTENGPTGLSLEIALIEVGVQLYEVEVTDIRAVRTTDLLPPGQRPGQ